MKSRKDTARIIAWLTGLVLGMVVIVVPLGYFTVSYRYTAGSLDSSAELNARIITGIISANPTTWEHEQPRMAEYLSHRPKKGHPEVRRVFNAKNEVVAESADVLKSPVVMRTAELLDSGRVVGRIELVRSLRPPLIRSGLLMLLLLPFSAAAFLMIRAWSLAAIREREEALRQERDTAQNYLDVAGVMFLVIDPEQRVSLINKKGCDLLGLPEAAILKQNWFDKFVPEKFRVALKAEFSRLKEAQGPRGGYFEYPVVTGTGEERVIAWHDIVLTDSRGAFAGTLNSGEDVTERKQLEDQLRHAQKIEAVGVLAGGIAHDFNNILAAIIGYASLLQMKMNQHDPMLRNVEPILSLSNQAANLVKSLLAFSRMQKIDPQPVRVNDLVRGMEKLLASLLSADMELRTALSGDDMMIQADVGQMEQVLMHLATNARDAMPDGGVVLIKTEPRKLASEFIKTHGYGSAGDYAGISVSDSGVGMNEEIKEKIFEPFFTTKEVGKGTGLGLSIVYGIIKQHNGYIDVTSEPGKGTTVVIYLPLIHSATPGKYREAASLPAGGTETVLVAEDDAAVRHMTKTVLQNAGYSVIEACEGDEAVRKFSQYQDAIRLIILDVLMPKKSGKATFDEIKRMRPDVKALFTSGLAGEMLTEQQSIETRALFLTKPATAFTLLKKVREALDA